MRKREEINLKKKKGIKNPEKNPCRESREWRSQTKNKKKKRKNSEDLESNLMCGRNPSTCPDKGHAGLGLEGVFYQPLGCDQANRVGFSGFHGNPPAGRPPARPPGLKGWNWFHGLSNARHGFSLSGDRSAG